jgi:hypothetical protein
MGRGEATLESWIGAVVSKTFPAHGTFSGVVLGIDDPELGRDNEFPFLCT